MPVFLRTLERMREMAADTTKPGILRSESGGPRWRWRTEGSEHSGEAAAASSLVPRAGLAQLDKLPSQLAQVREGRVEHHCGDAGVAVRV